MNEWWMRYLKKMVDAMVDSMFKMNGGCGVQDSCECSIFWIVQTERGQSSQRTHTVGELLVCTSYTLFVPVPDKNKINNTPLHLHHHQFWKHEFMRYDAPGAIRMGDSFLNLEQAYLTLASENKYHGDLRVNRLLPCWPVVQIFYNNDLSMCFLRSERCSRGLWEIR